MEKEETVEKPKDWKAVVAEGRNIVLQRLVNISWTYRERESWVKELNKQLEHIDAILLK